MPQIPAKNVRQTILDHAPWKPPAADDAVVAAVQALAKGTATPDQQRRALTWIIEKAAGTYDMSYRPGGPEGERDTVLAEGRRFVGNQIVKLTKIKIGQARREQ